MSFEGQSLGEVARLFAEHLNWLLARTVTRTRVVVFNVGVRVHGQPTANIAFRHRGQPTTAPLHTRFGPMDLFLGHFCASDVSENSQHILRTVRYVYWLTPGDMSEPLLRWEYVEQPSDPDARWSRHHLQGRIPLRFGDRREVVLNQLHLPTGWVPLEEIIRFCIVDLGVRPLSARWHEVLEESLEQFRG